jgi:cobalt/nickel transport system permease protein
VHIPDGFLAINTWVPTWIFSVWGLGYCLKKTAARLKDKTIPLMGVMAAFIFAAQMLNFPVMAGTSGHLLGGVLAAVLLGPYPGFIVISIVLVVQAFVFQDGGITTLGANIFNMAFIGSIGGYFVYNLIRLKLQVNNKILIATAIASWLSVVVASVVCAIELAISGISPLKVVLPAMVFVHIFIGIGEAVISTLVIAFVLKVRPDLIYEEKKAYAD